MSENRKKYTGVFPAFYACYEDDGSISPQRTRSLARYLINKGVQGLYVGGSSGECIYQSVEERKMTLEAVMEEVGKECIVIAHVACNNTADSCELARHAESLGVDAIASIPPIYFKLPPYGIAQYWNDISAAAPNTSFFIYNIPQLAGTALNTELLRTMLKNPRVIGVKNSSPSTQDIQMWKDEGGEDFVVFNGPDEQFISGLVMGACGGIGGTYAAMPELFLKARELLYAGEIDKATELQNEICRIIYGLCGTHGNMYATIKAILKKKGMDIGGARSPLTPLEASDMPAVDALCAQIDHAIATYC